MLQAQLFAASVFWNIAESGGGMGFAEYASCIQHLLFPDNALMSSLEFQV
jgi:hypothetical protein